MAMERGYWALGVRDPEIMAAHGGDTPRGRIAVVAAKAGWSVRSFRKTNPHNEMSEAEQQSGVALGGEAYRFEVYRPGPETPAPGDMFKVHVEMRDQRTLYVSGDRVIMSDAEGRWRRGESIPA